MASLTLGQLCSIIVKYSLLFTEAVCLVPKGVSQEKTISIPKSMQTFEKLLTLQLMGLVPVDEQFSQVCSGSLMRPVERRKQEPTNTSQDPHRSISEIATRIGHS